MTLDQARLKIRSWCAYQERSQHETRNKLAEWGTVGEMAEQLITELIAENYLNEERFARAFAGGKFRIKHWGKNKIKAELKWHQISEYCLKAALAEIDANTYMTTLQSELLKKIKAVKSSDKRKKYYATLQYLVTRGFETELVRTELDNYFKSNKDEFRFEE